mmetsp:Transcript_30531/g.72648  ORF Transcript_30531/g.72648 Transcript_30531/m.72648 type:complete len:354 (-) Transcript_30531:400-1461(-)
MNFLTSTERPKSRNFPLRSFPLLSDTKPSLFEMNSFQRKVIPFWSDFATSSQAQAKLSSSPSSSEESSSSSEYSSSSSEESQRSITSITSFFDATFEGAFANSFLIVAVFAGAFCDNDCDAGFTDAADLEDAGLANVGLANRGFSFTGFSFAGWENPCLDLEDAGLDDSNVFFGFLVGPSDEPPVECFLLLSEGRRLAFPNLSYSAFGISLVLQGLPGFFDFEWIKSRYFFTRPPRPVTFLLSRLVFFFHSSSGTSSTMNRALYKISSRWNAASLICAKSTSSVSPSTKIFTAARPPALFIIRFDWPGAASSSGSISMETSIISRQFCRSCLFLFQFVGQLNEASSSSSRNCD